MASKHPKYLLQNQYGTYYFQIRIPKRFTTSRRFFRRSLRTTDYRIAINRAWAMKRTLDEYLKLTTVDDIEFVLKKITEKAEILNEEEVEQDEQHYVVQEVEPHIEHAIDQLRYFFGNEAVKAIEKFSSITSLFLHIRALITNTNSPLPQQQISVIENLLRSPVSSRANAPLSSTSQQLISKPMSEAINEYFNWKASQWSPKHATKNRSGRMPKVRLIVETFGDIDSTVLSQHNINVLSDLLPHVPSNRTKLTKFKTLNPQAYKNLPDNTPRLSRESISSYKSSINGFLEWCKDRSYVNPNLRPVSPAIPKKVTKDSDDRDLFTDSDLKKLFESSEYKSGTHRNAANFWVPLLALFTGARQAELISLTTDDIVQDEDSKVWYIDINENGDKKLKTRSASRKIPIHPTLRKLGFKAFVKSKNGLLFEEYQGSTDKFSKWFNRTYLNSNNCNIRSPNTTTNKVFHSFRHNVRTALTQSKCQSNVIDALMGHSPKGSEGDVRYNKGFKLKELKTTIEKLRFPSVDFSAIQPVPRFHNKRFKK